MKTYLLSIPQRLKQQSATLDVKALLCNNAWDIINNDGQKQMFLFHNDGSLVVSTNGNVSICEWRLEPLAGTIVISSKDHAEMFKAGMVQKILVLAKDGSNEVLSLIDSKDTEIIPNRTVNELTAYLNYQDRLIEENLRHDKIVAEQQSALEEEDKRKEEEKLKCKDKQDEITAVTNFCQSHKSEIKAICKKHKNIDILLGVLLIVSGFFLFFWCWEELNISSVVKWIFTIALLIGMIIGFNNVICDSSEKEGDIVSWIKRTLKKESREILHLSDCDIVSIANRVLK